jgi:SPP1 gp7 family putative phage head morphogenesis protein
VLPSGEWWDNEDDMLFMLFFPLINSAGATAVGMALIDLPLTIAGESIINGVVQEWARNYTYSMVKGINDTTRTILQEAVSEWTASGQPLKELIAAIEPTFDRARAEMIATTEVTRAFAEGNYEAYRASGVVDEYDVRTAEDADVDEICQVEADGGPYPLTDESHKPPFHVKCRCWIVPVVRLPE